MRHIYLTIFAFLLAASSFANKITATSSSDWASSSTWNLNRQPKNNDSVVIPAGITVQLQNNVSLTNIVMQITGKLDMDNGTLNLDNASSILVANTGKILSQSNTDQINIGNTVKFKGNGQNNSVSGPSFANSTTGTSPVGFIMNATLPVIFSSFYASKSLNNISLKWSTSQEFNNNNFEVQRSFDGNTWTVISIVMGTGTPNTAARYSYTDKKMTVAAAYYRIRQVDMDGRFDYSTVKLIRSNETAPVAKIYVAGKNVNIEFNSEVKNNVTVRLFTTNGQMVAQQNYQGAAYKIILNNANLNAGMYVVNVSDGQGWAEAGKIML